MNDSGDYISVEDLEQLIFEKTKELESVFEEIDELQLKNDELQTLQVDFRVELNRVLRVKKSEADAKRRLAKERKPHKGSYDITEFNLENLDEEHTNLLRSVEDRNTKYMNDLNQLNDELDSAEKELEQVAKSDEHLQYEINKCALEKQKISSKILHHKEQADTARRMITYHRNKIPIILKEINKLRKQIIEADQKIVDCLEADNIFKQVQNLEYEEISIQNDIMQIEDEMEQYRDGAIVENEAIKSEIGEADRVIGWNEERRNLKYELSVVTADSKKIDEEYHQISSENEKVLRRQALFKPIHAKWYQKFMDCDTEEVDVDVDKVLATSPDESRKVHENNERLANILTSLKAKNVNTQSRIEQKAMQLYDMLVRYNTEQREKKLQITRKHDEMFTTEHVYVKGIDTISKRIANRKQWARTKKAQITATSLRARSNSVRSVLSSPFPPLLAPCAPLSNTDEGLSRKSGVKKFGLVPPVEEKKTSNAENKDISNARKSSAPNKTRNSSTTRGSKRSVASKNSMYHMPNNGFGKKDNGSVLSKLSDANSRSSGSQSVKRFGCGSNI